MMSTRAPRLLRIRCALGLMSLPVRCITMLILPFCNDKGRRGTHRDGHIFVDECC
jgi:hypothetical protein